MRIDAQTTIRIFNWNCRDLRTINIFTHRKNTSENLDIFEVPFSLSFAAPSVPSPPSESISQRRLPRRGMPPSPPPLGDTPSSSPPPPLSHPVSGPHPKAYYPFRSPHFLSRWGGEKLPIKDGDPSSPLRPTHPP